MRDNEGGSEGEKKGREREQRSFASCTAWTGEPTSNLHMWPDQRTQKPFGAQEDSPTTEECDHGKRGSFSCQALQNFLGALGLYLSVIVINI